MKIFWIGQQPYDEGAGEEVVDRKLKAALQRLGHEIETFYPQPVSRPREVFNLTVRRMPYYRARFESAESLRVIRSLPRTYDAVVASWEPFDRLALESPLPVVLLLHNITSSAIRSVFPKNLLARYLARRGARWEQTAYKSPRLRAVATLSVHDQRYVAELARGTGTRVVYTPPGMPPLVELSESARLVPELVLSGTYGWFPKRRDVLAFAREYGAFSGPKIRVIAAGLPAEAEALVRPASPESRDASAAIGFGLITDRFESGHKLKTTYYLANNAIVLSYADVMKDFEHLPDAAFFIRRVDGMASIARHVAEVGAVDPGELRTRLRAFQQACQASFAWDASARVLSEAVAGAVG